jgi:hypothetical protein
MTSSEESDKSLQSITDVKEVSLEINNLNLLEQTERSLLESIHDLEKGISSKKNLSSDDERLKSEISSFDFLPTLFNGIKTSTFGMSSALVKNPFFEISEIARDKNSSWSDRTQAVRYMQRIPHIHRVKYCIEATLSILTDEQYPLEHRYHFFSNSEAIIKLDYELVNASHHYFFFNFKNFKSPLIYKILSAQYLLTQFPLGTYNMEEVQKFLIDIAKDKNCEINYRAECADILDRAGYGDGKRIGTEVICELGELFLENKRSTIYTNLQNVHDKTVSQSVIQTLRNLIKNTSTTRNSEEVYNCIINPKFDNNEKRKEALVEVFQRILIDTAKYEGLSMCEIMMLVWEKIVVSPNREEMENRLVDEMFEMYQSCSTGHLSRLINVLSGFYQDVQPVKISYEEQLRSNVFARYTASLRTLGQDIREAIENEMTSEYKPEITDFIFSYSPREELNQEFVQGGYMNREDFNRVFERSESDFFGITSERKND